MAARRHLTLWALLLVLLTAAGCGDVRSGNGFEKVAIDGVTFELEVVADPTSRIRGLMHRESIPEHGGMLFVFPDIDFRSFWMAHCPVDMDVIFLDARGRVTAMHRMKALPPKAEDESEWAYQARAHMTTYWSYLPAQFAIEVRSGWLDRLDLSVDDKIELDLARLKAMAR